MTVEISTPRGTALVELTRPTAAPASLLVLGHGAGGGVDAPDLVAVRAAGLAAGVAVALVTQPYRAAGRRTPAPAGHLDEAWRAVLAGLRPPGSGWAEVPLVVGGRSSGARVACRTARLVGAAGVVALAFPTHPPGRPDRSRVAELRTGLPTLVVGGDRDPFGLPPALPEVDVAVRAGARHDLRAGLAGLGRLVVDWLGARGWAAPPPAA